MPQLLHFLKVDQGTQINKFMCLDKSSPEDTTTPSLVDASGTTGAPPLSNEKDVFINKSNEVRNPTTGLVYW